MQNSLIHDDSNHGSYTLHSLDVGNQKIKNEPNINYACVVAEHAGAKRKADDCEPAESEVQVPETPRKTLPPNGKKTKGRVKIKMEFIDNKLRRYTTFSKRKTGIMKKAYELSTLTGTQVMLLVASETGHVYTFATRKLQPMITSEAGKALIQTCLNSPDPPVGPGGSGPDQRMSATGFEEVDLTYTVTEDTENKDGPKNHYQYSGSGCSSPESSGADSPLPGTPVMSLPSTSAPSFHPSTSMSLLSQATTTTTATTKSSTISMQLPQATGFATILASGSGLPAGTVQIGTLQTSGQSQSGGSQQSTSHSSAVYRLPQGPLVTLPGVASQSSSNSSSPISNQGTVTVVPSSQQNLSVVSVVPTSTGGVPGTVMYQTAQGVVYATPTSATTLPEGVILNLGQSGTLSLQNEHGNTTQQFIIPVALTAAAQQQQLVQTSVAAGLSSRREKSRK